jgi:L,D-peptidoglycan transpeptidase YkuD (ErfK/YbiS/YcfS/YnhG family)
VVAVYGKGRDSADSTVVLYTKHGSTWDRTRTWGAHNGKKGWTMHHREGDQRSPAGVFTLTDAGGVLPDPGTRLPYTRSASFQAPHYWPKSHWHDFDYVIAIDYNRVKGTPPNDPTRPEGQSRGGGIWLHMDHGSGTSGCVSLSKSGMRYLLRALNPHQRPVVVMGDKAELKA